MNAKSRLKSKKGKKKTEERERRSIVKRKLRSKRNGKSTCSKS